MSSNLILSSINQGVPDSSPGRRTNLFIPKVRIKDATPRGDYNTLTAVSRLSDLFSGKQQFIHFNHKGEEL